MRATINGKRVTDRDSLHALLRDILTTPGKDRIITIKNEALLRERQDDYADRLLRMLEDSAESGHVRLIRKN